ncbi:MAG: hypothetical protein ABF384_16040 [Verrucomicrobiales bacterium]
MKNRNQSVTDKRLPPLCRVTSPPESEQLVIAYGAPTLWLKLGRASVALIFGSVFAGIFLFFGVRGWHVFFEQDLGNKILVAGALLIGSLFALYFMWQILWELFGTTHFIASRDALLVKRQFLLLTFGSNIGRGDLTAFQFRRHGSRESRTFSLRTKGTREHKLISSETNNESVSWVGKTLADWFQVPLDEYHSLSEQ